MDFTCSRRLNHYQNYPVLIVPDALITIRDLPIAEPVDDIKKQQQDDTVDMVLNGDQHCQRRGWGANQFLWTGISRSTLMVSVHTFLIQEGAVVITQVCAVVLACPQRMRTTDVEISQ